MRRLPLLIAIAYPVGLHLLLVADEMRAGLWLLLGVATSHALLNLSRGGRPLWLPLSLIGVALWSLSQDTPLALYLLPLAIYAGLLGWFGSSLLPGREPLLSRMARVVFDDASTETRDYTRRVTWLWSGLFLGMLLFTGWLTLYAGLETWSLFANIINYLITAGVALLEYSYRLWRFRRWPTRERLRRLVDPQRIGEWLSDRQ